MRQPVGIVDMGERDGGESVVGAVRRDQLAQVDVGQDFWCRADFVFFGQYIDLLENHSRPDRIHR